MTATMFRRVIGNKINLLAFNLGKLFPCHANGFVFRVLPIYAYWHILRRVTFHNFLIAKHVFIFNAIRKVYKMYYI